MQSFVFGLLFSILYVILFIVMILSMMKSQAGPQRRVQVTNVAKMISHTRLTLLSLLFYYLIIIQRVQIMYTKPRNQESRPASSFSLCPRSKQSVDELNGFNHLLGQRKPENFELAAHGSLCQGKGILVHIWENASSSTLISSFLLILTV